MCRVHLIGLLAAVLALPACAGQRAASLPLPAQTPGQAADPKIPEHPLAPDFHKLGEALATFWRAEERFPSDLEELRGFADEHRLDLHLTQLTILSLRSSLYGKVLAGECEFPYPGPAGAAEPVRSSATFELDATDPEAVMVTFEAATPDGQAYLNEALRVFNASFADPRSLAPPE